MFNFANLFLMQKQIQRLSGVQSRGYLSSYQLVEKLLNVTGQVGVKELAVRFGSFQAEGLAEELLTRYIYAMPCCIIKECIV